MHGLGNDYLYIYGAPLAPDTIRRLSDRHFGAGADGMIFIELSKIADFKMRIFNADGSEAQMCGNGIRCVGKYVYDKGYMKKTHLTIETLAGVRSLELLTEKGVVTRVTVDMGRAEVQPERTITADGEHVTCTPVSVGNPHAVVFVENAETAPLELLGPIVEHHPAFPEGVNVEFVQPLGENVLRMRVWERGSGVTMACGTGACAAAAAAIQKGFCRAGEPVEVRLDGGTLLVLVAADGAVTMTGPAVTVYEGETV